MNKVEEIELGEKEERELSSEELLKIVEKNEKEMYGKVLEARGMPALIKDRFAPAGRFFREIGEVIEKKGIFGFVTEKVFPLLYFPAWKEMWKMREEQRKREVMLGSVGNVRNAFEGFLSAISGDIVRDTADYERRAQAAEVKKEDEELVSDDMEYLLDELSRSLAARKTSRAEACVRRLEAKGNLNEIMREAKTAKTPTGKIFQSWDDEGVYNWMTETFGERRGHYMLMDFSEHFTSGHTRCKGMMKYNARTSRFEKRKDRGTYSAYESSKIQVEGLFRNLSHLSVVDEYYGDRPVEESTEEKELIKKGYYCIDKKTGEKKFDFLKASGDLKGLLIIIGAEAVGRGIGRANETLVKRMYEIADRLDNYIESGDFVKDMGKLVREGRRRIETPEEIERFKKEVRNQRATARAFVQGIRDKREEFARKERGEEISEEKKERKKLILTPEEIRAEEARKKAKEALGKEEPKEEKSK